jgi:hypothetical protein
VLQAGNLSGGTTLSDVTVAPINYEGPLEADAHSVSLLFSSGRMT